MTLDVKKVITIVKNYADKVWNVLPVEKVFLYSSYAKVNTTIYSDIDVYFFLNIYGDSGWFGNMKKLLSLPHKYAKIYIEPLAYEVTYLEKDNPFVKEVICSGIEIF